jgi:hypothetical protein
LCVAPRFHILYGMTRRSATLRTAPIVALALTLACATPPQKEIADARAAIESARAAGVDRFAAAELAAAADALTRAEAAVDQHDFRLALSEALDARARAQDAVREAATRETALRTEAEQTVAAIAASIDLLRSAIAAAESARSTSQSRKAVSNARRAIVVANVALQEARADLGRNDPVRSKAACNGVLDRLNDALTALTVLLPPPAGAPRR